MTEPVRRGRPAKKAAVKPSIQVETEVVDPTIDPEKVEIAAKQNGVPDGRIVTGETEIETRIENGVRVAAETVYRIRPVLNSSKVTYILVASEGTKVS